jgi:outer membrane protein OmpA-like peptidoglycan-associated protein
LTQLRQIVASLDDYRVASQMTVLFGFDQAVLMPESKGQLDQLATTASRHKRYFIAIEGYADQTGPADYNLELSKRRAEAVVQYLVGERNVDFNRIHIIGLGEQKPADTGTGGEARARNRRVEVKIYSADAAAGTS